MSLVPTATELLRAAQAQIDTLRAEVELLCKRDALADLYVDLMRHYKEVIQELKQERERNAGLVEALELIHEDYVDEGVNQDCRGCEYDGKFYTKHHEECVYVVARQALQSAAKLDEGNR